MNTATMAIYQVYLWNNCTWYYCHSALIVYTKPVRNFPCHNQCIVIMSLWLCVHVCSHESTVQLWQCMSLSGVLWYDTYVRTGWSSWEPNRHKQVAIIGHILLVFSPPLLYMWLALCKHGLVAVYLHTTVHGSFARQPLLRAGHGMQDYVHGARAFFVPERWLNTWHAFIFVVPSQSPPLGGSLTHAMYRILFILMGRPWSILCWHNFGE